MQLKKVTAYRIRIPFKQTFKHATAERSCAENIMVRCEDITGTVGWGETIAREYVTGESTAQTIERYKAIPKAIWDRTCTSAMDVEQLVDQAGFTTFNVARCGIEIALLDLMAKIKQQPLYTYCAVEFARHISIEHNDDTLRYGGAVGLSPAGKTIINALKMRLYGFDKVKLKLENNLKQDIQRIALVRRFLGNKIDLRVDANEAWDLEYANQIMAYLKKYRVSSIEQPFPKTDKDAYKELFATTPIPIILDESLCSLSDAHSFEQFASKVIFCIKLPKAGGFFYAFRLYAFARQHGIPIQLSCQVGESAILSAAGRQAAVLCPDLRYLEGSFDRYLLRNNVIANDISFGYAGKAKLLNTPGLGISVDESMVEQITEEKIELL